MRADTFSHLAGLCSGKGIVCERRGKKIELVTTDGSVTAVCGSVAEALDTFRNDATFAALPLKFRNPVFEEGPKSLVRLELPAAALAKIMADPEKFKASMQAAGFPVLEIRPV